MPALAERLQAYRRQGPYRQRNRIDPPGLIAFNSNDYLGLSSHPQVAEALASGVARYGVGSGGSHLICGHHAEHHALEEELADFVGRDRALLFSSGYMANLGVMQALLGRRDTVIGDRLNHASLIDAAKLSGAQLKRYSHGDVNAAKKILDDINSGQKLLVTDSVFSMDGDLAPLAELADLAGRSDATLMVDDAHGFGALGATGAGGLQALGLSQQQVPVLMATLGKAAGLQGAFVAGSESLIDGLIQFSRTYIYTTAMPAAFAAALRVSLRLIREESWRRQKLVANIQRFRATALRLGVPVLPSTTAIQGLVAGDNLQVLAWAQWMRDRGFALTAIRAPTVPRGSERLRITLSAQHTDKQIDQLVDALSDLRSIPDDE